MQQTFLRLPKVIDATGRSKVSIYSDIKAGKFPAPIKIGPRAVAWVSTDIEQWINGRISAAKGRAAA